MPPHDRALLDALEAIPPTPFAAEVWRVTVAGRDPLRGSTAEGRWSPPGSFPVLYTSLDPDGARAEIGHRLSQEPVWPSRISHDIHRIAARGARSARIDTLAALAPLGVDVARYASVDYRATQAIAAAARFLEFDCLVVPSARSAATHLVVFLDADPPPRLALLASEPVDWNAWRAARR